MHYRTPGHGPRRIVQQGGKTYLKPVRVSLRDIAKAIKETENPNAKQKKKKDIEIVLSEDNSTAKVINNNTTKVDPSAVPLKDLHVLPKKNPLRALLHEKRRKKLRRVLRNNRNKRLTRKKRRNYLNNKISSTSLRS